jgi:hypothetical protein
MSAMSSGAFALDIDQAAGGAPNVVVRRVIPLPPTSGGGTINLNQVQLSFAFDNFESDDNALIKVRIQRKVWLRHCLHPALSTCCDGRANWTRLQPANYNMLISPEAQG